MRKIVLIAAIASLILGAAAFAQKPSAPAQTTQSLTCTSAVLTPNLNCFWEAPITTIAGLQVTGGAYAVIDPNVQGVLELAPYVSIASYQPTYGWWVEVRVPKFAGVPVIGVTDPIRAGVSIRW